MPGYRTIPSKDTFDVDERLGGIVTVKQLSYIIVAFLLSWGSFSVANEALEGSSDSIYVGGTVLFLSLLFIFGNMDIWFYRRVKYYLSANHQRLEKNPNLLSNIRSEEEDKIVTLDGRVIAVLKVTPINFPLLSDEAKEAKIGAYETYLRQLVHPIMHLVQSEEIDLGQYMSNILRDCDFASKKGIKQIKDYGQNHLRFLRDYLKRNKSRTKNHYIVLQVQDPRYKRVAKNPSQKGIDRVMRTLDKYITEFNLAGALNGKEIFTKPKNYVKIDSAGKRLIFKDANLIPEQIPSGCKRLGQILQFDSTVAMLRFARSNRNKYYYGDIDLEFMLKEQFRDLPLKKREEEFSIEERRQHVAISGGKTRWAFDETEKHISVLSDKLEAAGLHVNRVRGAQLFGGNQMGLTTANKIKVTPHYLKADNTYMGVVQATGYPYQVNLGWLSNIVDGREDYDFSMYIYPVGINEAINTFRNAILKLSTEKKARQDFLDPETEQHLDDVTNFYSQIVSGKEKYFQASLYITAKANSLKQLDTVMEKCKSDLAGASIDFQTSDYDMAKAVYSTRLTGNDLLNKRREFPSSSLAATFPHISSSIEIDSEGLFFAFDWMNAPIIFDLKQLPNQHISILGESGSGKSYFAKSIIPRYLLGGYQVFVTDPDGEYTKLAKKFGGSISTIGTNKGNYINPLDLGGRDINDKIRSLTGLFSIMAGDLNKYQEGIISDILIELYENTREEITISNFAKALSKRMKKTKDEQLRHDIQYLIISVKPFLKGNIYGFVDRKTTINAQGQMHVFDLSEYRNDKTLRDFFNYVIFDFISNKLLSDKRPKALFMDEGWTMVNYKGSQNYVRYIIKDSRKYNVSFVFITQELEDMLSTDAGKSILNNTSTQFIFHQKESAMSLMQKTLNLTENEYEKLITVSKGEGLMISDKRRLFFKVHTSKKEHKIITTDPNAGKKSFVSGEKSPRRQGALSPALKTAMGDAKTIAKKIGIDPTKRVEATQNEEQQDKLVLPDTSKKKLPIALTHNLVSEEDKLMLLKPIDIPKKKKKKAKKTKKKKK